MTGLTHAMEDVFGAMRLRNAPRCPAVHRGPLQTLDVLRALVKEVTAAEVPTDDAESLTAQLLLAFDAATSAAIDPAEGTTARRHGGPMHRSAAMTRPATSSHT